MIDLPAYFGRIGYGGPAAPSLAVLRSLNALHVQAIPFENLDPLLGRPVELTPEALSAKLLHARRGGYCFEQNGLLHDVLKALGYAVTPLSARVVWMAPENAPRPALTHRITKASLPEGEFLVDVGFGGQTPSAPLLLAPGLEQETSHGTYRLMPCESALELQFSTADGWRAMYRFTQEPQGAADYELGNWFTATHPRSRFRQNLMVARIVGERRFNLLNTGLTIRQGDGSEETRTLRGARELDELLSETFGLSPPADAATIWERLPR